MGHRASCSRAFAKEERVGKSLLGSIDEDTKRNAEPRFHNDPGDFLGDI
jgi:hypothetical protein